MFRTNLAKAGIIFPKGHPYFKGVPKAELRKAISYLPPKNSYHTVKGIRGDKINVHILHNAEETRRNLVVADDLIKAGFSRKRGSIATEIFTSRIQATKYQEKSGCMAHRSGRKKNGV